jgi:hypothetical protein
LSFARRFAVLVLSLGVLRPAACPAPARSSRSVPLDGKTLDLTRRCSSSARPDDRIQVSTAPGPDGIVRRIEVRARETGRRRRLGGLRARQHTDEQIDRLIVAPHFRLAGSGLILAGPRLLAHRAHHAEPGLRARAPGQPGRRRLPRHARSRRGRHLRRRTAHARPAAALSVGAGRLQGQGQQLHALPRHRHRHRRPAGAVPDHRLRGQGHVMFPATAALAWAVLAYICIDFGFWNKVFDISPGRRAASGARRRGDPGRDAGGLPVRLSQPQPLARALQPRRLGWLLGLAAAVGVAIIDPVDRRRHRAAVARPLTRGLGFA